MATTIERSNEFKSRTNRVNRSRKRSQPRNPRPGNTRQLRTSQLIIPTMPR